MFRSRSRNVICRSAGGSSIPVVVNSEIASGVDESGCWMPYSSVAAGARKPIELQDRNGLDRLLFCLTRSVRPHISQKTSTKALGHLAGQRGLVRLGFHPKRPLAGGEIMASKTPKDAAGSFEQDPLVDRLRPDPSAAMAMCGYTSTPRSTTTPSLRQRRCCFPKRFRQNSLPLSGTRPPV
jgi:hypothetical protein